MNRADNLEMLGQTITLNPRGGYGYFSYKMSLRESDNELILTMQDFCSVKTRYGDIRIFEGLQSDGASIPGYVRWIAGDPFNLGWLREAVLHDQNYRIISGIDDIPRDKCDIIFRDTLWHSRISKIRAATFYKAVDVFGGGSYKKIQGLLLHV